MSTVVQPFKKFPAFYGIQRGWIHYHIHKSSPLAPILSRINPAHTITSRSILILSTYVHLGLPSTSGLISSGFPTNNLYASLLSSIHDICLARLILDLIILIILGEEYKLQSSLSCSFLHPRHFISLLSKYYPQLYLKLMCSIQFYSHLDFLDLPNGIF
jgi:hypothetical protein